jgi:hypothetical protein
MKGDGIQAIVEPVRGIGDVISKEVHPSSHQLLRRLPLLEGPLGSPCQLFEPLDWWICLTRAVGQDQGYHRHNPDQNEYDVF